MVETHLQGLLSSSWDGPPVFASSTLTLLTLMILAEEPTSLSPPALVCESEALHVEVHPTAPREPIRVCIRAGLPTTLRFDSRPLRSFIEVEEQKHVTDLSIGESSITILPGEKLSPGEHILLGVPFADGAAPTRLNIELVVHPTRSARLIDVHRRLAGEERRTGSCGEREPRGITALLIAGFIALEDQDLLARELVDVRTRPDDILLDVKRAYAYRTRASRAPKKTRIAFTLLLSNKDLRPWMAQDIALMGPTEEPLPIQTQWQSTGPLATDEQAWLVVETELVAKEPPGPFMLHLGDASGARRVRVGPLTLP